MLINCFYLVTKAACSPTGFPVYDKLVVRRYGEKSKRRDRTIYREPIAMIVSWKNAVVLHRREWTNFSWNENVRWRIEFTYDYASRMAIRKWCTTRCSRRWNLYETSIDDDERSCFTCKWNHRREGKKDGRKIARQITMTYETSNRCNRISSIGDRRQIVRVRLASLLIALRRRTHRTRQNQLTIDRSNRDWIIDRISMIMKRLTKWSGTVSAASLNVKIAVGSSPSCWQIIHRMVLADQGCFRHLKEGTRCFAF